MAYKQNYTPKFPFLGDQCVIASGRLLFNAKDDSAFIFAKESISLATTGSVHVNAPQGIFVNGDTIELGLNAREHLILGDTFMSETRVLYTALNNLALALSKMNEGELEKAIPAVVKSAEALSRVVTGLKQRLRHNLSKTSKTI